MLIWNLIWYPRVLRKGLRDIITVQNLKWVGWSFWFATENNFLGLFAWIWIETNFPLESPVINFSKSSFKSFAEMLTSWTTENNDVSSAKGFALDVKFSDKSFI